MGPYDYFVVLISVVVGLAITDLFVSLHRLLAAFNKVRWHWAAPASAALAAMLVIGEFMSAWFSKGETVRFPNVLANMVLLGVMFLGAAAALPDEVPEEGLDLKAFYVGNRRHLWTLTTLFLVVQTGIAASSPHNRSLPSFPLVLARDVGAAAAASSLIFVNRLWWDAILLTAFLTLEVVLWWNLILT